MPAIATFIPFVIFYFQNQLSQIYYADNAGDLSLSITPMQGYQSITLYAEADTRLFQVNNSDVNYLFIEEAKILFNSNNGGKTYFKMDDETGVVRLTNDSNQASFFTLITTPELHMMGQFQIAYNMDNTTLETSLIVIRVQQNPFQLAMTDSNYYFLETRGMSTTLPELES